MVIVALLLGLAVPNADAQSCSKYICKEISQNFTDIQCGLHDVTAEIYYLEKCANSTKDCQPSGENPNIWTCTTPTPAANAFYPGEKCKADSDCIIPPSKCIKEVCSSIEVGKNCTSSSQCIPGSSCQGATGAQVCLKLIAKDKKGCASSYDCEYNLACDVVSATDVSQNFCKAIESYKNGTALGSAASCQNNGSLLCSSGSCASITTGVNTTYYCTVPLKSQMDVPIICTSSGANATCNSVTDSKTGYATTGMCGCGLNANGTAYCGLNPGDTVNSDLTKVAVKWLNSKEIKKCNTMRRYLPESATCATNYYGSSDLNKVLYYYFRSQYYTLLYNSESCVVDTLYASYKEIEDKFNSAALLTASALLLAFA